MESPSGPEIQAQGPHNQEQCPKHTAGELLSASTATPMILPRAPHQWGLQQLASHSYCNTGQKNRLCTQKASIFSPWKLNLADLNSSPSKVHVQLLAVYEYSFKRNFKLYLHYGYKYRFKWAYIQSL